MIAREFSIALTSKTPTRDEKANINPITAVRRVVVRVE